MSKNWDQEALNELVLRNTISIQALVNILEKSGIINQQDIIKEFKRIEQEHYKKDS